MKKVCLSVGIPGEVVSLFVGNVVYNPKNGAVAMKKGMTSEDVSTFAGMHGLCMYISACDSHIMPAYFDGEEDPNKAYYLQIKKNRSMFLRDKSWLEQYPRHEQVPAADSIERWLKTSIMDVPEFAQASKKGKLLQFERALNTVQLLRYCTQKNEISGDEAKNPEAIWWDAMRLHLPDGTVLDISHEGPMAAHTESMAISSNLCIEQGDQRETFVDRSVWFSTTRMAGTA